MQNICLILTDSHSAVQQKFLLALHLLLKRASLLEKTQINIE